MTAPTYIRPVLVSRSSPFVGDHCALCKEAFVEEDRLVICPADGSRHHQACWEANDSHCTAFGCEGQGQVVANRRPSTVRPPVIENALPGPLGRFSKVRTLPSSSVGCAQTCMLLSIALAIIMIAAGCFGLWAVADYILLEVLGWQYRAPFTNALTGAQLVIYSGAAAHALGL